MKLFKIEGTFPAENIDDAFRLLGLHFTALSKGEDPDVLEPPMQINIEVVESLGDDGS